MTIKSLRHRLYCHSFKARQESPKLLLHRAWKLHGEPVAEVIEKVPNRELAAAEIRQIAAHGSFGEGGYNMTPGGEDSPMKVAATVEKVRALALTPERIARNREVHLGSKRSLETLKLMSQMRKGKPVSDETRHKMSATHKAMGTRPPTNSGRRHSKESKSRMSEFMKKAWTQERKRSFATAAKKRQSSEEYKTRMSDAVKLAWQRKRSA